MSRAFERFVLALAAVLFCLSATVHAGGSLVVRGATLLPMSADLPERIENGVLVIRDGRVVAVGDSSLELPADLPVVDMPGTVIMPGMIAANTTLAGRHSGDESISGLYHAVDSFDRFRNYRSLLEAGITAVHLDPGDHRLVSGAGAVVRLSGHWNERVLNAASDVTVNLSSIARNPPNVVNQLSRPSANNLIEPAQPQRPSSRMEEWLALRNAIEESKSEGVSAHLVALRRLWESELPLRVQAGDSTDALRAVEMIARSERAGYVVGSFDLDSPVPMFAATGTPLVYGLSVPVRGSASDLGQRESSQDADLSLLNGLGDGLALSVARGVPLSDLRLAAATATRSGLDRSLVLRALTANPASILGVADQIGSLTPGRLADFIVWSDDPLATTATVNRVYMNGQLAYRSTSGGSVVVRAGTVWAGPNEYLHDAEVLVTDGRIVEVGRRVARPRGAEVINAGPDGFVVPGFIDGRGHLGLQGDRAAPNTNIDLSALVGVPGAAERRVASSGVTSVMLSPYGIGRTGSRMSAIKSYGEGRADRVVRSSAGVMLDVTGSDPISIERQIEQRLGPARQYDARWKKYEQDLAEWEKAQAEGRAKPAAQPRVVQEQAAEQPRTDPITGTWSMRATAEVFPEPISGDVALKLNGKEFEGRATAPEAAAVEHRIVGTLDGNTISGRIEIDTGGFGTPTFTGTLDGDDRMSGTITLGPITAEFNGERTSREEVQFRVTRRRATDESGRPKPPAIDEALEPWRPVLAGRAPLVVAASTALEIDRVVSTVVDKHKLKLVLIGAEFADVHAGRLASAGVGVLLPSNFIRNRRDNDRVHLASELSQAGVHVAFQSGAEDGARNLGLIAVYAVEQGMSPEDALSALTLGPARMFGLEDRIGSIAPGMDADLVIYDGHPMDATSRVRRVLIQGQEVGR